MLDDVVDTVGGTFGLLLLVNLVRLVFRVRFTRVWHVLVAYGVGLVVAITIYQLTTGNTRGGGAYILGMPFAVLVEIALLYRRASNNASSGRIH